MARPQVVMDECQNLFPFPGINQLHAGRIITPEEILQEDHACPADLALTRQDGDPLEESILGIPCGSVGGGWGWLNHGGSPPLWIMLKLDGVNRQFSYISIVMRSKNFCIAICVI